MKFFFALVLFVSVCDAFVARSYAVRKLVKLNMAEVSTAMVKELREKSGAGIMDCKKALSESNGDIDGAVDWLRKKGLAAVAKKASRTASSGLVGVAVTADGKAGAVVEINSETDFSARNDLFVSMMNQVCAIAASSSADKDTLLASPFVGESPTVQEEITRLVATIGENMNFRRAERLTVNNGQIVTYVHMATKPNLGKRSLKIFL